MAQLKFIERDKNGRRIFHPSYHDLIYHCCFVPNKVIHTGHANIKSLFFASCEMEQVARAARNDSFNYVCHMIISFFPDEVKDISTETLDHIAQLSINYYAPRYQIVYGIHNTSISHIHIIMNRVSFIDGTLYLNEYQDRHGFRNHVQQVLSNYNIQLCE